MVVNLAGHLQCWLQTLAVLAFATVAIVGLVGSWVIWAILVYCCPLCCKIPLVTYAIWIYIDRGTAETGSRRSRWVRSWPWFKYVKDYFPITLVKTTELSPSKNYIFALFPHGLMCNGALFAFGAEHCGFDQMYPGLRPHVVTLSLLYNIPWLRELALALGHLPASARCIRKTLESSEKGQALCVVVGGVKETMYTKPGVYKVYLKNRKGFIRIALETGASLVPVVNFGEPDLYDQIETKCTWLRAAQNFFKKLTGIPPVLYQGRGVFPFGIIPKRRPINVVIGKPIDVEKSSTPSEDKIKKLHVQFIESLQQLFDTQKSKYLEDPETKLIIS